MIRPALLILWLATAAHGDPLKPWARGVSDERQAQALEKFRAANRQFEEMRYDRALAIYRQAIAVWDHPAIRFNVAICLVNLDQTVEAHENLTLALRYGDAPLGKELYAQGLTYRRLLEGQLARVRVLVPQPGVLATLDGRRFVVGPGQASRLVRPGPHQLVGSHPDLVTEARSLMLLPGRETSVQLRLRTVEATTRMERRFARWVPWAWLGAGAGFGIVGLGLDRLARSDYEQFDRELAVTCPRGCPSEDLPESLRDVRARADLMGVATVVSIVVGGAVTAMGVGLLVLNQPRPVRLGPRVSVGADVAAGGGEVSVTWRF